MSHEEIKILLFIILEKKANYEFFLSPEKIESKVCVCVCVIMLSVVFCCSQNLIMIRLNR